MRIQRLKKFLQETCDLLTDDSKRVVFQYTWVYIILMVVSLFMSVVNIFTEKYLLMGATLSFFCMNLVNIMLCKTGYKQARLAASLFCAELVLLFVFFIISGQPEGFSATWICLLPSSGLLLFQRKRGTAISMLMLIIMIFLFQTPWGEALLQYPYTNSFKLRFPMLYLSFFAVSFFLEFIRSQTYDKLIEMQKKYEYLYTHDALTNVYNRHGFNEKINHLLKVPSVLPISLLIVDVDYFKTVNDRYGHVIGDEVLKSLAEFLVEETKDFAEVCRWGGEEFALLYNREMDAKAEADKIVNAVEAHTIPIQGSTISITVSIGAATLAARATTDEVHLVAVADSNLYKAKNAGRNRAICENIL